MKKIKVINWISYEEAQKKNKKLSGIDGFFTSSMNWQEYLNMCQPEQKIYIDALKTAIIKEKIKKAGDWHQWSNEGVPLFSDGVVITFSWRSWGNLLAAMWEIEEGKSYDYIDFYITKEEEKNFEVGIAGSRFK